MLYLTELENGQEIFWGKKKKTWQGIMILFIDPQRTVSPELSL